MDFSFRDTDKDKAVAAIESNFFNYWAYLAALANAEFYNGPDLMRFISGSPTPLYNLILRANFPKDNADQRVQAALDVFQGRSLPLSWWVGPISQPDDLDERLGKYNVEKDADVSGMALRLPGLTSARVEPEGLTVIPVTNDEQLAAWRVALSGLDLGQAAEAYTEFLFRRAGYDQQGPLVNYIGVHNGHPVACSTLFIAENVAGIYNISLAPNIDNPDYESALLMYPLQVARERGCLVGVLEARGSKVNLVQKLGFEAYCTFQVFTTGG